MSTSRVHDLALSLLNKYHKKAAIKYNLKKAVMVLGPSGFPFEHFVAQVLRAHGYKARVGSILKGYCVSHEVDILAVKSNRHIFVECKYHNRPGVKSDLKVVLYVRARFEDIRALHRRNEGKHRKIHEGWLITNTKFTKNVIRYGQCAGLNLIGWSYPNKGNLQDLIEETALHPLTCLTTLSKDDKKRLFDSGVVLCRNIKGNEEPLRSVGISGEKTSKILEEAERLCVPRALT